MVKFKEEKEGESPVSTSAKELESSFDDPGDDMAIIGRVVWSGRRM